MKKKIIAIALCLLMLLPLAFIGCKEEEEPPAPPPPPPTENTLDNIEYTDTKTGASTLKSFDFDADTMVMPLGNSFVASAKAIYDTEDPTKHLSTEYKLFNIYNDTVITATTNEAIASTDEGYANAITQVLVDTYDDAGDFAVVYIGYGDGDKGDLRLYNKFGVLLSEVKGINPESYEDRMEFDDDFNDEYSYSYYGPRHFSFLKKVYRVKEDDLTLTEVIDFNKASFDLESVVYVKEIDKYIAYEGNNVAEKVVIFSKSLVLESAHEFVFEYSATETYCTFLSPTVAVYTEMIPVPGDASEYDACFSGRKVDIKVTKFDFATGEATDMAVNDIVLCAREKMYNGIYYDMLEEMYGMKLKAPMITSEYFTLEGKTLITHNDMVVIDENLNVLKYIENAFPSDEYSTAFKLPNGELIMMTTYGLYHVNADGTLGALITLENTEYNNLWRVKDGKEVYDNTNALIYTIPETRELVAILNNSLILSEKVKNESGVLIGYKYFLWKGVGNETKLGDDPFDYNADPSTFPTEGTFSAINRDIMSNGYYAIMTGNWADIIAGNDAYTITLYDDLGNQLAKYENVTDYDIDHQSNSFLSIEITTYDAEQNPTVTNKIVVIINQEKFEFHW